MAVESQLGNLPGLEKKTVPDIAISKKIHAVGDALVTGRVALCLSYNGANYHGWQAQKSGIPTVQKYLEAALSKVANQPVAVICAGRTDASVHSSYQIVHFETSVKRSERAWVFGCNANLPDNISVSWAGSVDHAFHARFSATSRRYNYLIYNHPIRPSNFNREMTWSHYPLDVDKMHQAAQYLVGQHDFSSFRAVGCQANSPIRNLEFVNVQRFSNMILIDIKGNAFLHHMVRNIAGVLIAIGSGKQTVKWCEKVLQLKDRTKADVTASPHGLYLTHVDYPDEFGIPKSAGAPSLIQALLVSSGHSEIDQSGLWDINTQP
ncbi:MAG: tRNA pseudouridine38-40 synthase [Pseudohongiellaceae bacterium]|jgi:tRNA pseudouridine38-40 synthase